MTHGPPGMVLLELPAIKFDKPFTKVGFGVTNFVKKLPIEKSATFPTTKKSAKIINYYLVLLTHGPPGMVPFKLPAIKFDKPFTKVGSGVTNF